MKSICPEINVVIKMASDVGNEIKNISEGWSNAKQVISMEKKLDVLLKNKVEAELKKLKYFNYVGSPHNEPDEGFVCEDCKVGISFPITRNDAR